MSGTFGIDTNKPVHVCMVVGCKKKAIYRKAASVSTNNTQRGYCSDHRSMAVGSALPAWKEDYVTRRLRLEVR